MAITDNLVAYWKLDESSGNATDSVGSYSATNNNVTYSSGIINNGAVFSGASNSYLSTSYNANLTTFSFSFWIYTTTTSSTLDILGRRKDSTVWFQPLRYSSAQNNDIGFYDGAKADRWTGASATANQWNHCVFTVTGGNITLYLNGTSQGSKTITISNPTATLLFGMPLPGSTTSWNGKIDEIGLWDRVLTSAEATQLYNAGAGLQYPFTTNSGNFLAFF